MLDTLRLFVAVPLPPDLQQYLVRARQAYDHDGIRQVPNQNLHLTLFFIGNVPATELSGIQQKLTEVAMRHAPFTLTLQQLEPGPNPRSPRLVWARFQQHEACGQLSLDLTSQLALSPPKKEKFIPHVTLCRFKKDFRLPQPMPLVQPEQPITFQVSTMALWQSTLASPHPVYQVVQEFGLQAKAED